MRAPRFESYQPLRISPLCERVFSWSQFAGTSAVPANRSHTVPIIRCDCYEKWPICRQSEPSTFCVGQFADRSQLGYADVPTESLLRPAISTGDSDQAWVGQADVAP
jgi:hypothetical protein